MVPRCWLSAKDDESDVLLNIEAVTLHWLDGKRWLRKLSQKAGHMWLLDESEQKDAWSWVLTAPIGDTLHRREGLWFVLEKRVGNKILLTNYEDQCYEALRVTCIDFEAMD